MSENNKNNFYKVLGVSSVIFVLFLWPHTLNWDGDGTINAFPSSDSVKNYRLDATMTVESKWKGWFGTRHFTYTDITGEWPNGGSLELEDCTVFDKEQASCSNQDGDAYGIEVVSAPDAPESDYSDDY